MPKVVVVVVVHTMVEMVEKMMVMGVSWWWRWCNGCDGEGDSALGSGVVWCWSKEGALGWLAGEEKGWWLVGLKEEEEV